MNHLFDVGDTVVVVKGSPCCGDTEGLGLVYRVDWIAIGMLDCVNRNFTMSAIFAGSDDNRHMYHVSQLKKIPPLDELEKEKADGRVDIT